MKIPEFFAQSPMETSGLPRAPAGIADVGAGIEAEAITQAGGAISRVSGMLADIEAEKQLGRDRVTIAEMKGALDDFEYSSIPDPTQFTDIEGFKKAEEKYLKDWNRKVQGVLRGKNPRITNQFKVYTELHRDRAKRDYHNKIWPMEKDYAIASLNKLWSEKFVEFVNKPNQLKAELQKLIQDYDQYLSRTAKQQLEANIDGEIAKYQKQTLLETVSEAARAMPYKEALYYINVIPRADITETERNSLISQRKRQEEITTATTNPKVRWDTLRQLQEDPRTVTDEILEGLVGKGLTWDDAEEFKKIRDTKSDPLNTPRAQLYFNRLDMLYSEREEDTDEGRQQAYEWDVRNEKMMDYFKRVPDATANDVKEFYDALTDERKRSLISRLFFPLGAEAREIYGFGKPKAKKAVKKPVETFKYIAINPKTGERMGSNDGIEWQPIQ